MKSNLLEAKQVAKKFNITLNNLYTKLHSGIFPESLIFRLGKRRIYFKEDKLNNWIESGGGIA